MVIELTRSFVLAIVAAAVGAMAILGLIGVLVNRFRKQRQLEESQKKSAKRPKSGSPKRKKSNQEAARKIYSIHDDTYSMGTFDGGLGTFRTEPFPTMAENLPPNDSRSMGGSPFTPKVLEHSFIQPDDFDDVWSFIAASTARTLLWSFSAKLTCPILFHINIRRTLTTALYPMTKTMSLWEGTDHSSAIRSCLGHKVKQLLYPNM